jgi:glycosyltransferase involved in cell wall biosynthesis
MSKILVLHDTFLYRGGGERLVLMMANALGADIASGFFSYGSYNLREQGFTWEMISLMPGIFLHEFRWLPKKAAFICKNGLRHFGLKWAFRINAHKLAKKYDTIIFSGDCLSAIHHFKGKKILYYCHTIPRYLFDQRTEYEKKVPKIILPLYRFMTKRFKKAYLHDLGNIETLITNSKNTQKRIRDFTGRDADILYPPVDTDYFRPETNSQQPTANNYYLSFARLSSIKRVDKIVEAFQKMPEENLIITYGKNDPEKAKIEEMVQEYPNIIMRESPSDSELRDLIRGAKATIYVPVDEDFGMSPVESMACGTPVIWVNDGGLKESIIDGKTGILIDPRCQSEDIIEAIKKLPNIHLRSEDCVSRASDFSLEKFTQELQQYIWKSLL